MWSAACVTGYPYHTGVAGWKYRISSRGTGCKYDDPLSDCAGTSFAQRCPIGAYAETKVDDAHALNDEPPNRKCYLSRACRATRMKDLCYMQAYVRCGCDDSSTYRGAVSDAILLRGAIAQPILAFEPKAQRSINPRCQGIRVAAIDDADANVCREAERASAHCLDSG